MAADEKGALARLKAHRCVLVDPKSTSPPEHNGGPPIKVLILIPSLAVGGAEMDLVRVLPSLDPTRFKIVVCTFLERATLAEKLTDAGIEVIGPFLQPLPRLRRLRSLARRLKRYARAFLQPLQRLCPLARRLKRHARAFPGAAGALAFASKMAIFVLRPLGHLISGPRVFLRIAIPIARYIRVSNVDIVHTILPNAYVIGAFANSLAHWRPLVMSRLSLNWYQERQWVYSIIERYALHRLVDLAIGNSEAILKQLRAEGLPNSKLLLVYNGIDAAAFASEMVDPRRARHELDIPQDALVFSCIANLFPRKGHRDLLNALHGLRNRVPLEWVLLAVGRDVDDNLADLLRLSNELGLSQNVRFLGQRLDIPAILSAADIHVSASHYEGFPNNIVEAMCAGLPVVATAVGGVPELVVDSHTGLLVPEKNPEQMANALSLLANDPEGRRAMGAAGRARVKFHFTIERSVAAFEETYCRAYGAAFPDRQVLRREGLAAIAETNRSNINDEARGSPSPGRELGRAGKLVRK
jgi:glycosyltransferase involved in cell wall biosynthesis